MPKNYNFDSAWKRFLNEQMPPGMDPAAMMGGAPPGPPPGPPPAPFYEDLDEQGKLEVDMALGIDISEDELKKLPAENRFEIVKARNDYLKNKTNKEFRDEQDKAEKEAEEQEAMAAQAPPPPGPEAMGPPPPGMDPAAMGPPPGGMPPEAMGPPPGAGGPPPGMMPPPGAGAPPPPGMMPPPPPGAPPGPPNESYIPYGMQKLSEELYHINKELDEGCMDEKIEDELSEMSATANSPGYSTPHAFSGGNDEKRKRIASINSGMTTVGSLKENKRFAKNFQSKLKSEDSQYSSTMKEIYGLNYPSFKKNESLNSRQKVNGAIKEINSRLFKIERVINRAKKLKSETGITSENYWKATTGRMSKIAERLLHVARSLREFKN